MAMGVYCDGQKRALSFLIQTAASQIYAGVQVLPAATYQLVSLMTNGCYPPYHVGVRNMDSAEAPSRSDAVCPLRNDGLFIRILAKYI